MKHVSRASALAVVAVVLMVAVAVPAVAGKRSHDAQTLYIGGAETYADNEASFRLNHLNLHWDKGILKRLEYYVTSYKDAKLVFVDCQYLADTDDDGKLDVLWKQSAEETLGFIIDNLDESKITRKHYQKNKFFTGEVPFDLSTGVIRWVVEIQGKTYHVDWNLKANEIAIQEAV